MSRRRGFLTSVGALSMGRGLAMASQILILPILARYLSPSEFGLAALATSVATFANMLSDGGMGRSLIRTSLKAEEEWSSVFWFLCALGVALCLGLFALTPAMVWLFDEPELFWPLTVLAFTPLILSLKAAFEAEIEQRNAFAELALSETVTTVIALFVAMWMAIAGYGVWALIAQQLLLAGLRAIWVALRSRFRPRFRFSQAALGSHFRFGRDIVAASLLGYLREQSTPLVIGKVLGTADLGIFIMTARFMRLPMFALAGPFGQVLYVRLTRAIDDPTQFREIVLASIRLLGFAILPLMTVFVIVSETAFVFLLSERWSEVAPIFMLIAGGAALTSVTSPTLVALAALGQTMKRLRMTVEITVLWLILLGISAGFGLQAIAAARTIWRLLLLPRQWAYLSPACGVTAQMFVTALLPGTLTACAVGIMLGVAALAIPVTGWAWLGLAFGLTSVVVGVAGLLCNVSLMADLRWLRE